VKKNGRVFNARAVQPTDSLGTNHASLSLARSSVPRFSRSASISLNLSIERVRSLAVIMLK
jgi:hypothetical protein